MDIKAYIASGILEQYVLGQLSADEEREVEKVVAEHAEAREELQRIEQTMESFARLQGQTPPPGVLAEVLHELDAPSGKKSGSSSSGSRLLPGLLTVLAVVALVLAALQYRRADRAETQAQKLQEELETACDTVVAQRDSLATALELLRAPRTRPIVMAGTPLAPEATAILHYNAQTAQALLTATDLPQPPTDRQYQLWAIVNDQPVDLGVFELDSTRTAILRLDRGQPQAFAITLEPRGGSAQPTLDQMYVSGGV